MVICHCERVSERAIRRAIREGEATVDAIVAQCGAGGRCGGCRESIEELLVAAGVQVRVTQTTG